ncbi:T-complex protein 11-like protein 1 [Culicoides brevitarsis]|uniref:T-complex protein 11-like protein 1 n=1 Tax=Culicoides brevitarsis TaxID=469753 RepID=UPI00307C1F21
MPADKMDTSDPKEIPGTSNPPRIRTESENSDKSGSGAARFLLPGTSASPPKILTLDEVQSVVKNIEDMALAHEIAVNADFKLEPYEPPENSLEKIIKDTIHKAFWDVLREQLNSTPPIYSHAIQLLGEIKEMFEAILPSNNKRTLERINEILDETVIQQQAEQNVLDFKAYANFIIHIMGLACAPIRDEQVAKLKEITDVVEMFRAIMETLSLMKLDMANNYLNAVRNDVVANTVEYERKKFKEYLEVVESLPATEAWLKRNHVNADAQSKDTIFKAYLELIDWKPENEFPEIMSMDKDRVRGLQSRALRLTAAACCMVFVSGVPVIGQNAEIRKKLVAHLMVLLQNVETDKDLEDTIESIWLHIKSVLDARLSELNQKIDEATTETLKTQVHQIAKPDSPVRTLLWKRFVTYISLNLRNNAMIPTPPGFTDYVAELESIAAAFKRLTYYNHAVYREYYQELLDKINKQLNPTVSQ